MCKTTPVVDAILSDSCHAVRLRYKTIPHPSCYSRLPGTSADSPQQRDAAVKLLRKCATIKKKNKKKRNSSICRASSLSPAPNGLLISPQQCMHQTGILAAGSHIQSPAAHSRASHNPGPVTGSYHSMKSQQDQVETDNGRLL